MSGRKRGVRMVLCLGGVLSALVGGRAEAQQTINLPQVRTMSPGGVDLASSNYLYTNDDISSGDLVLTRTWQLDVAAAVQTNDDGFTHSLHIFATMERYQPEPDAPLSHYGWMIKIHVGSTTYVFTREKLSTDPTFSANIIRGLTLTWTGSGATTQTYTFTDANDTKYVFNPMSGAWSGLAYVDYIEKPDGSRISFSYDGNNDLRLVSNNRGFALGFDVASGKIAKVCALNLATTYFSSGTSCPGGAPAATYTYGASTFTYTDATGGAYVFSNEFGSLPKTIKTPASASPWLTLSNSTGVFRQDFIDGGWFTYTFTYDSEGRVSGSTFTNPQGTTTLAFNEIGPGFNIGTDYSFMMASGPSTVTDPLNRTVTSSYCTVDYGNGTCGLIATPTSQMQPEGNKVALTYDALNNPLSAVTKPKPGSGLSDLTVSATYDVNAYASRTKPLTYTDAKSNTTTFTYDATHGGVLTETDSAVLVNGTGSAIAPVKRYAYVQRYAWLKTSGGSYAQAATPVSLLSTMKTCRTTATVSGACAGGSSDEVVTTYDYGPNSGPNNLLLRGMTVTADVGGTSTTLRTCYGYDAQGNRISGTKPRAGLTVCP